MTKAYVTVTFEYEIDESLFPGGLRETDIQEEELILHDFLKTGLNRTCWFTPGKMDVTIKL